MSSALAGNWAVTYHHGGAGELHQRSYQCLQALSRRTVVVQQPRQVTLVLGSTQAQGAIDARACAAQGVEVAKRRSGGGAVLVGPEELVWVDFLVPAADPLWDADVGRGAWWLGEAWATALASMGLGGADVWRGGLQKAPWSALACFAGVGAGEVTWRGRKVVGISQRRSRQGALLQSACLLRWQPGDLVSLFHLSEAERHRAATELDPLAMGVGAGKGPRLVQNLLASLA